MRDFPSCFGESGVQVADASCSTISVNKSSQNCVTCIYKCKIFDKSCLISLIWGKNLMGQSLSIEIDDESHNGLCKFDIKLSLFSKRKGSKCLSLALNCKIEVFWDLSLAKFGSESEPLGLYYIAIVCRNEMCFLIGDLVDEAFKKTRAIASLPRSVLVLRRENVFGKRVFGTKARVCETGPIRDIKIECDTNCGDDCVLVVCIDEKSVVLVNNLRWKFRGNCTIVMDGHTVEVFWDIYNWLFGPSLGNAVFMFRTSLEVEKASWMSDSFVVPWRCSESFEESKGWGVGCSLILYAWKHE